MACTYIYEGKKYNAWEFADVLASMPIDDLMKYLPGAVSAQLLEATQASRLGYDVQARKKAYTDDRQLQLFLDSEPDPSQTGPASDRARREAVAAVDDLRSTGTVLGQSLSGDYAARQRVSLVGQKVSDSEELAILAQVYRDPRFETFRLVFTDDSGNVVSQVGLTSRLPASATAVIGDDVDSYLKDIAAAAKSTGATGFYMLHNHPSGLSKPSDADVSLTKMFAASMPGIAFQSHVVIDTNEYSVIDRDGYTSTEKKDFGQPKPFQDAEWGGLKIEGPADVMAMAKKLQVDDGAITLIHTNAQNQVKSITTIPESVAASKRAAQHIARAALGQNGANLFAVGRSAAALGNIGGLVTDSILVSADGTVQSLRATGAIRGGNIYPARRDPRVSQDTSAAFDYLKRIPKGAASSVKVGEANSQYSETMPNAIEIDGVMRSTFNSNGKPIAQTEEGIRNFYAWFGDSKVVDDRGRPLVVYHGSGMSIHQFANQRGAIYFTPDLKFAESFAIGAADNQREMGNYEDEYGLASQDGGETLYPVYLSANNLFDPRNQSHVDALIDEAGLARARDIWRKRFSEGMYDDLEGYYDDMQSLGFDGFYEKEGPDQDFWNIGVFDPAQIKSATGNIGTFDPANPDIRYSRTRNDKLTSLKQKAAEAHQNFNEFDKAITAGKRETDGDTYFDMIGKLLDAKKALAAELVAMPDDGFALQAKTRDGRMLILNQSAQRPGYWQLTRFDDKGMPWGDTQYQTKSQAIKEFITDSDISTITDYGMTFSFAGQSYESKSTVAASRERLVEVFGKSAIQQLESMGLLNIAQSELEAIDRAAQMYAEATGQPIEDVRNSMLASVRMSRAWHGSPYKFDKFSTEHIGTGEGASRYGWGLYFTDKKEIAEHYRSALTDAKYYVYGVEFEVNDPVVEKILFDNADDLYRAAGLLESYSKDNKAASEEISSLLVAISDNSLKSDVGSLYEVEIPEDDVFLLWDSPISEQPDAVRTAIMSMPSASGINLPDSATGEQFYEALVKLWQDENGIDRYEAKAEASLDLNEAGVKGIKYLDGQSRSAGKGNFNYVVFDDADVHIIDVKYSADGAIQGFYVPKLGKAFVVADNVAAQDMPAVVAHEVGVHMAMDGNPAMEKLAKQAANLIKLGRGNPFFDRIRQRMNEAGETSNEEAMAYLAEEAKKARDRVPNTVKQWLKDLVAAVKSWLFRKGVLGANRMNEDDILAVAMAYVKQAAAKKGDGKAKFSKNLPDTINIDGVERPTRNSNGQPIHPTEEGIRNFWKWFGDSQVVDLNDRPIDFGGFYIKRRANIISTKNRKYLSDSFNLGRSVKDGVASERSLPDWFVKDDWENRKLNHAKWVFYEAGKRGLEHPRMVIGMRYGKSPDVVSVNHADGVSEDGVSVVGYMGEAGDFGEYGGDVFSLMAMKGRGVHLVAGYEHPFRLGSDREELVVYPADLGEYDPTQIKSATGNYGTFDGTNPDIRFSRAGGQSGGQSQQQTTTPPKETTAQAAQRKIQDKLNRFTVIKEWLAEQGIVLSELADVHKTEERMHSRFANKAEDFREKRVKPLVEKIQKAGFSMDDVAKFLHAQHAKERNDQIAKVNKNMPDGGSGMTNAEAAAILAASSPELAALANELRSITVDTKNILLNSGLISKDLADAWDGAYQYYVPLKGGPDDDAGGKGTGKGLSVREKQRRALGHEKREDDTREDGEWIIENILGDHERALMQAEKNRVFQALLKMAIETSPLNLITINKPEKRQILKNQASYVVRVKGRPVDSFTTKEAANLFKQSVALSQKGVSPADITIEKTYDQTVALMASPMPGPDEATGYVNGHLVRVQFNDDLLARAYNNMGAESLGKILQAGRALNNYFSKIYTGYNPEFLLVNVIRDFQTGLANTTGEEGIGMAMKAAKNYVMRFRELFRYARTGNETKWVKMYREDGGNTGAAYLPDLERLGSEIQTEYKAFQGVAANLKNRDYKGAARAAMRKVFDKTLVYIEHVNQAGENAMRLAVYQAMVESGRSRREAASLAKNVTVNFNRKGELGAQANALYLFFNASVQGTAAVAHSHFKGKHRMQAWGFSSAILGMGYLLSLLAAEADEEEYEKTSEYERSRNILIPTGNGLMKIPVAFGYGFFWNFGRSMADAQRTGNLGKTPWHIASSFVEEFTPFGGMVAGDGPDSEQAALYALPTIGQIAFSPIYNRTSMGIPMMPSSFSEHARARDLMNRPTRGTWADDLAGLLEDAGMDVSPETLKHYARTFTGGAGMFADSTVSAASLKLHGAELDVSEIPFLRKLYTVPDVRGARARYYEAKSEADKALADFNRAVKRGDMETANEIQAEQGELLALARLASKQKKRIKAARDRIDSIRLSGEYGKAAERHIIKNLEAEEEKIYDNYMAVFKAQTGR